MTPNQKNEIKLSLKDYCDTFMSQKKAAASLEDCSEATIIQILNGKFDSISDNMWNNIAKQIGTDNKNVVPVETLNFQTMILYYSLAKEEGATFAIIGGAGFGKSFAGKWYAKANRQQNVYYLECAEYWNKKMFLQLLLNKIGKHETGLNVGEMMQLVVRELRKQDHPLIILDEIDKLPDVVLYFFITLYNELNRLCGFVWTSTHAIEKRMIKGINSNRRGYSEIMSRIGSRFIGLKKASASEIREICEANGITNQEDIHQIINECRGDLRRVERNFLKHRAKNIRPLKRAI